MIGHLKVSGTGRGSRKLQLMGCLGEGIKELPHSHPDFLQGAPASWWNHLHFQHHAKPNCFCKDPDINMHPFFFALGKILSVEVSRGSVKVSGRSL